MKYMSMFDENQKTEPAVPPFLKRWSILFHRYPFYPYLLHNLELLFDVIIRRNPILWNNVMEFEKKHPFCKGGVHTEECRKKGSRTTKRRQPGTWRDES